MTKEQLKQYRALKKEIGLLDRQIEKLREQEEDIPTVAGKVTASSKEFPYIEEHITVQMDEPKKSDAINSRIRIKKHRLEQAQRQALQIEQFIAEIPDSTDRQIFEMAFLEGKTQREIAETIGYTQGRVAQKIKQNLKD